MSLQRGPQLAAESRLMIPAKVAFPQVHGMQGVLLAAGYGRRFDPSGQTDKLLQPLEDGRSVLWHSGSNLLRSLGQCVAVIRPGVSERRKILEELGFVVIEARLGGMGEAIAVAVRATATARGWVIGLADMPWIPSDLITRVAGEIESPDHVAAPWHAGRRGHPVAFGSGWRAALESLTGDVGARDLLSGAQVRLVEPAPSSVHRDVDLPCDLHAHREDGGRGDGLMAGKRPLCR